MKIAILLFLAALAGAQDAQYTADGSMRLPANYREWIFLSSGLGMTYAQPTAQDHPNFDNVFASPDAYKAFLKTGSWPEKTVLVLEIRASDSQVSINTGGHVQAGLSAVEIHVKDSSRFKGGWGFFGFGKADTAKLIPASANCYSCHQLHGAVESTFVQFYPTLIDAARQKGTFK